MTSKLISIDNIFSKINRDLGDFDEGDAIEWIGEALEHIGVVTGYEEAIAFIEIKDHQGVLPTWLHQIIQVARNNGTSRCTPITVCENAARVCGLKSGQNPCTCPSDDAVWLDCSGKPIVAYELAYYRPYFDLNAEYLSWSNTTFYKNNFSPVRLSNNTFFGTLVTPDEGVIYSPQTDEYTIVQGKIIRTSFRNGQVCISYYRQPRDKMTGYPMIPDEISYRTAIVKYVTMKTFEREFYNGRDGAKGKLDKAESDWQWYCGQASSKAKMPEGIDEYQNLLDQRLRLLPNHKRYYGFFGNLSKPDEGYPTGSSEGKSNFNKGLGKPFGEECTTSTVTPTPVVCNVPTPPIKTITGDLLTPSTVGMVTTYNYVNSTFKGFKLEIFANPFNRYLVTGEYEELPQGGFKVLIGGPYTIGDTFKIIPNGLL